MREKDTVVSEELFEGTAKSMEGILADNVTSKLYR